MISSEMPRLLRPCEVLQDPFPSGQLWYSHCSREGRDRSRTEERNLLLLSVLMTTAQQMASLAASQASSCHTSVSKLFCNTEITVHLYKRHEPLASAFILLKPCMPMRWCDRALVIFCPFGISWLFWRLSPILRGIDSCFSLLSFLFSGGLPWPCFRMV